jgi:hypothetical protein
MGGVKLWYPQASSEATAKLLLCLWALHHDNQLLTCYHVHTHPKVAAVLTMLAPHSQKQPAGPSARPSHEYVEYTSHTGAPQQQSAHTTQPSHKYVRKSALQQSHSRCGCRVH